MPGDMLHSEWWFNLFVYLFICVCVVFFFVCVCVYVSLFVAWVAFVAFSYIILQQQSRVTVVLCVGPVEKVVQVGGWVSSCGAWWSKELLSELKRNSRHELQCKHTCISQRKCHQNCICCCFWKERCIVKCSGNAVILVVARQRDPRGRRSLARSPNITHLDRKGNIAQHITEQYCPMCCSKLSLKHDMDSSKILSGILREKKYKPE